MKHHVVLTDGVCAHYHKQHSSQCQTIFPYLAVFLVREMTVTAKMINLRIPLILDSPLFLLILPSSFLPYHLPPCNRDHLRSHYDFHSLGSSWFSFLYLNVFGKWRVFIMGTARGNVPFGSISLLLVFVSLNLTQSTTFRKTFLDLIKMEVFLEGRPRRPGSSPKSQSKECSENSNKNMFIPHALITFTQSHGFPPWCCLLIPSLYFPSPDGVLEHAHSFIHSMHIYWAQVVLEAKNPPANARDITDTGWIPGSGRSPGEGNGNPLQYSCLENSMDGEAWQVSPCGLQRLGCDWSNLAGNMCTALYSTVGI